MIANDNRSGRIFTPIIEQRKMERRMSALAHKEELARQGSFSMVRCSVWRMAR
jgi:hypothetical protein